MKKYITINHKHSSSMKFKIVLLFFILNLTTNIYSQKYKVTYSGSLSTSFCSPDPFISSETSVKLFLGTSLFLQASCNNQTIDITNASKEINFKPDKINAVVTYKPWLATKVTTKTDIIPLNLNQCDSWNGDYNSFPNTAGIGIDNFSFTIEPVIALIEPSTSPSCSVFISADNLGFSSDIYNWVYTGKDNVETPLPAAFQGRSNFNITLEDIFGSDAPKHYNETIHFQIKYCQTKTNIISFTYVHCSPELAIDPPLPTQTKCKDAENGSVTLEFKTELNDGEKFLFNIWNNGHPYSKFVTKDSIINKKYTWHGLAEGTYTMKYQAQELSNNNVAVGLTAIDVKPFIIGSPDQLSFTATETQPKCSTDSGSILISAKGGTPQYKYKVLNTDSYLPFTSPTPINLSAGNYVISVTDANGCVIPSQSKTINPAPLAITINGTTENESGPGLNNGKINLASPLPNTPSYTFKCVKGADVFTDLQKLAAGTYTITTSNDSGCANDSKEFIVKQNITCNATTTNVICSGGSDGIITLNIQGGSKSYLVTWKDGSNNLYPVNSPITTTNNGIYNYIATGFKKDTYSYTITDEAAEMIVEDKITILAPTDSLTASLTKIAQPSPGKTDGILELVVNGGYGNYSYAWEKDKSLMNPQPTVILGKATGLGNGNYKVSITDKDTNALAGCTINTDIIELKALNVSIDTPTAITCQGSTTNLTATASGGDGTITYKWFESTSNSELAEGNSLNNIKAGTYKVEATDDKNTASATIIIPDSPNPIITAVTSQTPVKCYNGNDGTANIKITNAVVGTSYTFKWYKETSPQTLIELTNNITSVQSESTITGLTAGNYTVTATDGFCLQTFTVTVNSVSPVVINEIPNSGFKDLKCFGDSNGSIAISVSGGTIPYTYVWKKKDGSKITANNNLNPTSLTAGNYSVEVEDANHCTSLLENIIINPANQIQFTYTTTDVTCKNSNDGSIQLNITGGTVKKDANNKPLYTISCNPNTSTIDIPNQRITNLSAGKWNITVSDDNNCIIATQQIEIKEPSTAFSFGFETIINTSGNGISNGSIQINNTGGWENYSYKWYSGEIVDANKLILNEVSNLLKNQPAGKYTAVATDKNKDNFGCSLPAITFEIKEPEIITLDVTATNTKCNNGKGSIMAIANGGAEIGQDQSARQYSYELFLDNISKEIITGNTANFMGLEIGKYTVIATDTKANTSTITNTNYKNGIITTTGFVELTQPTPILVIENVANEKKLLNCYDDMDGILSVSVSGGTPITTGSPYNYVWKKFNVATKIYDPIGTDDPKQFNLSDGTYSVEVHDANYDLKDPSSCIGILDSLVIAKPTRLEFTYTKENVSCLNGSNGSIKLNITGGTKSADITKPYTIICNTVGVIIDNQNSIVSGLTAGKYTIKVIDGNLCKTDEQIIEIEEPNQSVYIASQIETPTSGFGLSTGKIEITAAGGTPGYNYQWKNNSGLIGTNSATLNNTPAGTYTVLVTDTNGCSTSKNYTVEEPSKPLLTETHLQSKCNGLLGSLDAVATGGATYNQNQANRIYTYKLKNKISGAVTSISGNLAEFTDIADGDYSLTATDISGVISNTIDVLFTQPTPIVVSLASKANVNCYGDHDGAIAISVSGGTPLNATPEYTYQWKKKTVATDNYEPFTPSALNSFSAGIYSVEVRDANYNLNDDSHCIGLLENIEITQPDDFHFDIDKITYTNPSASGNDGKLHFEITGGKSNYEYKFYTKSATGIETVISTVSNSGLKTVDFNGLTKDHYYISAKDDTGCIKYTDFDFRDNPLVVSIIQTQNISCYNANNGILKVNINGGFGSKKISWYHNNVLLNNETNKENLLNVQPGNYYAIVKDSKMVEVISNTINITQPDQVVFSATQQPVKCFGDSNGQITLTASGGNGNFRYRYFYKGALVKDWQNFTNGLNATISDLAEGEYAIYVKDTQECENLNSVTIKVTSPAVLAISNTVSVPATGKGLSNGSIAITAQGGNGNYTYKWFKSDNTNLNQNTNTALNLSAGKYYAVISDLNNCTLTSPLLEVTEPPLLETNIAVQNVILCNGDKNGSLKPTTTGGVLKPGDTYTYQWFENGNPTVLSSTTILNGIGKGSYYVIATDSNGNKATSQILAVSEPTILANLLSADYVLCGDFNDWTINATASGGTQPYNYVWNTLAKTASIQNVPPGNYSVLASDTHGCSITKTITVTAPAHLDATAVIKIPTCYNGSDATIIVTPIAGIAPYTYLWSTGEKTNTLSNAAAGNYSVEITDSKGCLILKAYKIVDPPKDVINLGDDVTLCFDQSLTINSTIADDKAKYSWTSTKGFTSNNPIITVSEPADYTLVVTNKKGCKAADTVTISSQNTAISAEFAISSQVFKNEKIIIVDISNPAADQIEWVLPSKANVLTKNKDYAEISFSEIGEYEITLNTKKGNCTAFQTKQILVTEGEYVTTNPNEIDDQKKFDLKIYPNPSQGKFTVDVTLDKVMPASVKVYNLSNNLLIDSKIDNGKDKYLFDFNLSGLSAGVYFVLFESEQGSKLRKIIIQ